MFKSNLYIDFNPPITQEKIELFMETLNLFDLEFVGESSNENISGVVHSNGMFNLIKAPLIKALEYSDLKSHVKKLNIGNIYN